MTKVYGILNFFTPVRSDRSRLIISYDCQPLEDGIHATWNEIYFYKKPHPYVSDEEIKEAILSDINANTDEKIRSGFVWNNINVWLSIEYQFNFKAAYDLAVQTNGSNLPIKFKLGETEEKEPVYHTFTNLNDLTDFYTKATTYINQCLNDGWQLKDSINWNDYKRE